MTTTMMVDINGVEVEGSRRTSTGLDTIVYSTLGLGYLILSGLGSFVKHIENQPALMLRAHKEPSLSLSKRR